MSGSENKVWHLYTCMGSELWTKKATYTSEDEARLAEQHQEQAALKYKQDLAQLGRIGNYLYMTVEMDANLEPPTPEEAEAIADEEVRTRRGSFTNFMYFNRKRR